MANRDRKFGSMNLMGSLSVGLASEEVDESTSSVRTSRSTRQLQSNNLYTSGAKGLAAAHAANNNGSSHSIMNNNRQKQQQLASSKQSAAYNVQDTMKIIMDEPKLWQQFKARMAAHQGSVGSSAVSVQAVLKDFVQDHPELEARAKQQAIEQQQETLAANRRMSIMAKMTSTFSSGLAGETAVTPNRAASMGFSSSNSNPSLMNNNNINRSISPNRAASMGFSSSNSNPSLGLTNSPKRGGSIGFSSTLDNSWSYLRSKTPAAANNGVSNQSSAASLCSDDSSNSHGDHIKSSSLSNHKMGTFEETEEDGYQSTENDDEDYEVASDDHDIRKDSTTAARGSSTQQIYKGMTNLSVSREADD